MSRSFFHLTPNQPDHVCMSRSEVAALEHEDFLESLSPEEKATLNEQAAALANLLYNTINTHCGEHPDTSFGAIVQALDFVQCRIDMEMQADEVDPDDCDA